MTPQDTDGIEGLDEAIKWKEVVGYNGLYVISSDGQVKNNKRGKLLKSYKDHKGYIRVSLNLNGIARSKTVHRLMMEAFTGEDTRPVNHKNGIKTDNRLNNLEYVSVRENTCHAFRRSGGLTGARLEKAGSWISEIYLDGKQYKLARFPTELQAHEAYMRVAKFMGVENRYAGK